MDPRMKRWETGLVCEKCKRKAVALTLFNPGDVWDGKKFTRKFVGKRLCCSCTTGLVTLTSLNYDPGALWRELFVWVIAVLFFGSGAAGLITESLNLRVASIVLWLIFFSTMVAVLVGLVVDRMRRRPRSEWLPTVVPRLVSLEAFYSRIES